MPTPESLILKAICQYLTLQERLGKCWFARTNNGGTYDAKLGRYRMANGPGYRHGVPDIISCIGGRFVGIEVKAAKGVLSPHQKDVQASLQAHGGIYVVARSVADVEAFFHG